MIKLPKGNFCKTKNATEKIHESTDVHSPCPSNWMASLSMCLFLFQQLYKYISPIFLTRVWITKTTCSWKSLLSLHLMEYIQSRFLSETTLPSAVTLAVKNTSSYACCPFSKMKQNSVCDQKKKSKAEKKRQCHSYLQGQSSKSHPWGEARCYVRKWCSQACTELLWEPCWTAQLFTEKYRG